MGRVDIADQLRSYYCTQQRSCCNWYSLFYWLLDTTLVNSYRIQKTFDSYRSIQNEHSTFRTCVANKLIQKVLNLQDLKTEPRSTTPLSTTPISPALILHSQSALSPPLPLNGFPSTPWLPTPYSLLAATSPTWSSKPEASTHSPPPCFHQMASPSSNYSSSNTESVTVSCTYVVQQVTTLWFSWY